MNKTVFLTAALAVAGIGVAGAGVASASDGSKNDAIEMQALTDAKLSAVQAIDAAQATQPGKVAELQFNLEKNVPNYEITVLAADGVEHNFMVDATSGKVTVIAANEDRHQEMQDDDFDGDQGDQNPGDHD